MTLMGLTVLERHCESRWKECVCCFSVNTIARRRIAIFSRDASDNGKLSFIQVLKNGQNGVDGLGGAIASL